MAKNQPDLSNIFQRTTTISKTPSSGKDTVKAVGVGLRKSEWIRIEAIAAEMGVTAHALAAYALRDFVRRYDAGERPQTETKVTLPNPLE